VTEPVTLGNFGIHRYDYTMTTLQVTKPVSMAFGVVSICVLTSCAEAPVGEHPASEATSTRRASLGVPQNGYPSHDERVVLFFTNRMRADPQAFETWISRTSDKKPVPPVSFGLDVAQAARWQAIHQDKDGCPLCKDHSSCCTLAKVNGQVKCTDAVGGCGGTAWNTRIRLFSSRGGLAENAAAGPRSAERAMFAWLASGGHWNNINKSGHVVLGPGADGTHFVQVFAGGSEKRPIAAYGTHFYRRIFLSQYSSRLQDADKPTFGQVYYMPSGAAPKIAMVVVEGTCHALTKQYGSAKHGSYEKELQLPKGCHRYVFHFRDSSGKDHVYPSRGSLVAGINDSSCKDYDAVRPPDSCSPSGSVTPSDQGVIPPADRGVAPTPDKGVAPKADKRITPPITDEGVTPPKADKGVAPPIADKGATPSADKGAQPAADGGIGPATDFGGAQSDASVDDASGEFSPRATNERKAIDGGCAVSSAGSSCAGSLTMLFLLLCFLRRRR
jgi:hypothetical protein